MPSEADLEMFIGELAKNEMTIRPIIVRRLIKNEQEKLQIPDLIDLEYDLQLNHAVNMLKSADTIRKSNAS